MSDEDSSSEEEKDNTFATDKATIIGSIRSEKSQKLMISTTGRNKQLSSDSSDSEGVVDALNGVRHSERYKRMLDE